MFREDEALLKELRTCIPEELTQDDAENLFTIAKGMFQNGLDDLVVIIRICERILPCYEVNDDTDHLARLYLMLGNEYAIFYRLVREEMGIKRSLDYFRRLVSLRHQYGEIRDRQNRKACFFGYLNLMMFQLYFGQEEIGKCLDLRKEAGEFAGSDIVKKLDGNDPEFLGELEETFAEMDAEILKFAFLNHPFSAEEEERIQRFIKEVIEPREREGKLDKLSEFLLLSLRDGIPEAEWFDRVSAYLQENIPDIDFSDPSCEERFGEFMEYYQFTELFLGSLQNASLSEEQKQIYADRVVMKEMDLIASVPYLFHTEMLNSFFAEWYPLAEPFLKTGEEKYGCLVNLLIRRQPITYIHSLMVSKIAAKIAAEAIYVCPGEFIGILGCSDEGDVRGKKKEILQYVKNCGLLHDVGKCYITDVVNRQNRALTDPEFDMIRKHPELGLKIVNQSKTMEPYFDVILGHHKSYDGKLGYPASYDNTASKIRFIVDLITIADSVDAATDNLGRNYSEGKNFARVFEELKEGAGKRYNPTIVKLIEENEKLAEKLDEFTSSGRFEVYRQAYGDILSGV